MRLIYTILISLFVVIVLAQAQEGPERADSLVALDYLQHHSEDLYRQADSLKKVSRTGHRTLADRRLAVKAYAEAWAVAAQAKVEYLTYAAAIYPAIESDYRQLAWAARQERTEATNLAYANTPAQDFTPKVGGRLSFE